MNLSGQTVLITGANRGLGACRVTEALARGAETVYAVTRTPFTHRDARVNNVVVELTDPAGVQRVIGGIDRLDLVINNAGVAVADDAGDASVLRQHLDVNLFGAHAVVHAALPALLRARGALVNVLSIAALAPAPIITSYSVSKAAAFSLTLALRNRLAGQGVRVHAALPGPIDTEMSRELDAPKTPPAVVAAAIFDGVAAGEEDIFPDPMSAMFATGWADSPTKAFERAQATYVTV